MALSREEIDAAASCAVEHYAAQGLFDTSRRQRLREGWLALRRWLGRRVLPDEDRDRLDEL